MKDENEQQFILESFMNFYPHRKSRGDAVKPTDLKTDQ
jgi:hypothetical protein